MSELDINTSKLFHAELIVRQAAEENVQGLHEFPLQNVELRLAATQDEFESASEDALFATGLDGLKKVVSDHVKHLASNPETR